MFIFCETCFVFLLSFWSTLFFVCCLLCVYTVRYLTMLFPFSFKDDGIFNEFQKVLVKQFRFVTRAIDVRSSGRETPQKKLESWSQVCSRARKLVYNKKFIAINYVSGYLTSHIRQRVFFCLIHIFFSIFSKKEDYLHTYSVRHGMPSGCKEVEISFRIKIFYLLMILFSFRFSSLLTWAVFYSMWWKKKKKTHTFYCVVFITIFIWR